MEETGTYGWRKGMRTLPTKVLPARVILPKLATNIVTKVTYALSVLEWGDETQTVESR